MRILALGLIAGLALTAAAGIPIDSPLDEPRTNDPGRGIFVPDPTRGVVVTNIAPILPGGAPAQPSPPNYQTNLKLKPAPVRNADVVRMRGRGELWPGTLTAWDGTTLTWDAPVTRSPVPFQCGGIAGVSLAYSGRQPVQPSRWLVRLVNGDVVAGYDLTMDTNEVALTFGVTSSLKIARACVASVQQDLAPVKGRFHSLEAFAGWDVMAYEFPGNPAASQQAQPARVYRDLDLPDRVALEFPYSASDPSAQNTSLQIGLFVTSPDRMHMVPSYNINIQGNIQGNFVQCYMSGGAMGGWRGANDAGQVDLKSARGRDWVDLGFRVDRQAGRIVLTVDGEDRKTFEMRRLPDESGRGMLVQCQQVGQRLPRRMILTPLGEGAQRFGDSKTQDTLLFANGAMTAGRLGSIGATNFIFDCSMGRMSLPIERLIAVSLALSARKDLRPKPGEVTIELRGGGQMTGALTALTATGLVADVEWTGSVSLPRSVVANVWWEPYPRGAAKTQSELIEEAMRPNAAWWPGTVQLTDGQQIGGTLAGFDTNAVYWRHPAAAGLVALRRDKVAWGATLVPAVGKMPAPVRIEFANGDQASGVLLAMNEQAVKLQPVWGEAISVQRAQVARVRFCEPVAGVLDTGGSANWKTSVVAAGAGVNAGMTVTNGVVTLPLQNYGSTFFRQGALPKRLCIQFDLCGLDANRQLQVQAFTRTANRGNEGVCLLSVGGAYASLQAYGGNPGNNASQGFQIGDKRGSPELNGIWLLDRGRREMAFVADGKVVGTLQARGDFPGGEVISFSGGGLNAQVRRIILSEWRGGTDLFGKAPPAGTDSVWRHDMTRVTGNVTSNSEGRIYAAMGAGSVTNLPLGEVSWIDFNASGAKPEKAGPGFVRLYLPDGDRVLLSSARYEKDVASGALSLVGNAPAMGAVTVPANAIVRVDFRP